MIYTNNISKFEKNLSKQLELTLNVSELDYSLKHSDRCLYLTYYGVLSTKELAIIKALFTDDFLIDATEQGVFNIWTLYGKDEEEEGE